MNTRVNKNIGLIIVIFLWIIPRIAEQQYKKTLLGNIGNKTCEYYLKGDLEISESFVQAMKDFDVSKKTMFDRRTKNDLDDALKKCGIDMKNMEKDSTYKSKLN